MHVLFAYFILDNAICTAVPGIFTEATTEIHLAVSHWLLGGEKKRSSSACKVVCIENLYKHINPFILTNILAGFAQGKRYSPCAISLGRNSRTRKLGFTLNPRR